MKRILTGLAALLALTTAALAAGTIPFSLSQQFDERGKPLGGCKLYTIQAGTVSTPQNAYQDLGLTIPLPNPVECDAAGRLPQFFLDDGTIKVRLTDKAGVTQVTADNILVIGPSSGGGGGGGGDVDPTTIASTADVKYRYSVGPVSGWVRANGRTIGSASSGATERANADCQALFEYLWGADSSLPVSGGRGVSAAADWSANKTITLPDFRGRVLAGLDDMGTTSADRLSDILSSTTLGSSGGAKTQTLTVAQIPSHRHLNTLTDPGHQHSFSLAVGAATWQPGGNTALTSLTGALTGSATTGITITNAFAGGGEAHPNVQPTSVVTLYIKL